MVENEGLTVLAVEESSVIPETCRTAAADDVSTQDNVSTMKLDRLNLVGMHHVPPVEGESSTEEFVVSLGLELHVGRFIHSGNFTLRNLEMSSV